MFLNLISIPNAQHEAISDFAESNELLIVRSKNSKVETMEFDWQLLPELLEAVPELKKRMWLFNASEDVIDCAVTYDSSANDASAVNIWFAYFLEDGRVATNFEHTVSISDFEAMLDVSNLAEFENDCMVREIESYTGWGGEATQYNVPSSVSDWVDEFGYNEREVQKLFPAFVAMFAKEMNEAEIETA